MVKILFAASEAVPFVKTGGLADVSGSLTRAIRNRGHACRVVLPLYDDIPDELRQQLKFVTYFNTALAWRNQYCGVFEASYKGLKYYFLDNEYYFKRRGLYGFFDDAERFAFFSKAVLEMIQYIDFAPDIIHCNDWQTALVPVYLNVFYRHLELYQSIKTVFTIHNIQYQGEFDRLITTDVLGLPESAANIVEYRGDCNFMKGAIEQCDSLTTVSPSYAHELMDPWYAHGMDELLRSKRYKLQGILNGIDASFFDPQTDTRIFCNYSADSFANKAVNKQQLQASQGLEPDENAMLIGMVGRLADHKGMDLVRQAFSNIMNMHVQVILLGSGEWHYEKFFREMVTLYPQRVSATIGFDDALSMRIYSGADVFLMPSKSEPCGISQLISMRYGTLPIVRITGGLRDTVTDFGAENGNGYNFLTYNAGDMFDAIRRAFDDFQNRDVWNAHIKAAMQCDFSWNRSAADYLALYKSLTE